MLPKMLLGEFKGEVGQFALFPAWYSLTMFAPLVEVGKGQKASGAGGLIDKDLVRVGTQQKGGMARADE
jgi:hypothetical protein